MQDNFDDDYEDAIWMVEQLNSANEISRATPITICHDQIEGLMSILVEASNRMILQFVLSCKFVCR
jgi:hypothetical protein